MQLFDVVAVVDGVDEPMVLRPHGKAYQVVAAAYVGNRSRQALIGDTDKWKTIVLE